MSEPTKSGDSLTFLASMFALGLVAWIISDRIHTMEDRITALESQLAAKQPIN